MHYEFSIETDDLGRMEARVLSLFERLQAIPLVFCSLRIGKAVVIEGILEIEARHGQRLEPLLWRLEGFVWRKRILRHSILCGSVLDIDSCGSKLK